MDICPRRAFLFVSLCDYTPPRPSRRQASSEAARPNTSEMPTCHLCRIPMRIPHAGFRCDTAKRREAPEPLWFHRQVRDAKCLPTCNRHRVGRHSILLVSRYQLSLQQAVGDSLHNIELIEPEHASDREPRGESNRAGYDALDDCLHDSGAGRNPSD